MGLFGMKFLSAMFIVTGILTGCVALKLPDSVNKGLLNNDDLEIVREGLPSYIVVVDGYVENYPNNISFLMTSAALNGAYAGLFVEDEIRKKRLTKKSLNLSLRALCAKNSAACDLETLQFDEFSTVLSSLDHKKYLPTLYSVGSSWASYIEVNSGDWNAIAKLAQVELLMKHIVSLDPEYENGMPYLFLAVLKSLIPPALGGKPDEAKFYFDKANEISGGRNLIVNVYYARQYARIIFDQTLHDELLNKVINADPHENLLTLQNVYAQSLAEQLLSESAEYFE